jgi:hypothetical protein
MRTTWPRLAFVLRRRCAALLLSPLAVVAVAAACNESASAAPTAPAGAPALAVGGASLDGSARRPAPGGSTLSAVHLVVSDQVSVIAGQPAVTATALCPDGEVATGGGYRFISTAHTAVGRSEPVTAADGAGTLRGWKAEFVNNNASGSVIAARAVAVCVPTQ